MKRFVICLTLAFGGCAGTETGNPNAPYSTAELLLNARSSNHQAVTLRQAGGAVVVEQAWLTLDTLSFREGADCTIPNESLSTPKIGLGDHSGPDALRLNMDVKPGSYCQATATFMNGQVEKPLGAPEQVLDHSIVIVGRLEDGTPLTIASNFAAPVQLDATQGAFEWGTDSSALLVEFDLAVWLKAIDLAGAVRDPVLGIVIDELNNQSALTTFEGNVAPGVTLYRDIAGNGDVDPGDIKAAEVSL